MQVKHTALARAPRTCLYFFFFAAARSASTAEFAATA
ncbi:MAG: hypothetical protein QOF28_3028, partial [Actinomycetota bacterium]|nr:hypothetical protein [Actinomycetota bacterium]